MDLAARHPDGDSPFAAQLNFLADALDALSAHIAIIDRDGTIVAVNGAWRKFAALNDGDIKGFNIGDNYLEVCSSATGDCGEDAVNMAQGIRRVIQGEVRSYYLEYECHTPDGPGWYQVRVTPFHGDAGSNRFVVAHENITEAKRAERELRASQSQLAHLVRLGTMGELAAGIAHELNQPLSAISNYASGCRRRIEGLPERDRSVIEALEEIASQANRAGEIIRRLRKFVKRSEPRTSFINVPDAIEEAVGLLRHDAHLHGINIETHCEDRLPAIPGDAIQVQQVLMNLVRNAIDAVTEVADPGAADGDRPVIRIYARMLNPQNIRIEVVDSGPGIRAEDPTQVFDAFFTTKANGLGLGLSLSSSIVDAHGGSLAAKNNADRGATFQITLPIVSIGGASDTPVGDQP